MPIICTAKNHYGKVTNASSANAIIGATVTAKSSKEATQTDAESKFSLTVPSSAQALVISFVGFETK